MEEILNMYSTELIRKFPETPFEPILYVVYNEDMINDAETLISIIHGEEYVDKHVKVVAFNASPPLNKTRKYQVYIDPLVYTYKHSWND